MEKKNFVEWKFQISLEGWWYINSFFSTFRFYIWALNEDI